MKKQQKNLLLILILSLLTIGQLHAQIQPDIGVGWSYDSLYSYRLSQTDLTDSTESGAIRKLDRWDDFWNSRASHVPIPGMHPLTPAYEGIMTFMARTLLNVDWCMQSAKGSFEQFGPAAPGDITTERNKGGQMIGRVESVWLDPDDATHALLGSFAGGLYETKGANGLQHVTPTWTNITDNAQSIVPGSMGITSIGMPPPLSKLVGNPNQGPYPIYLSTSIGHHYDHFYGVGLVYAYSLTNPVWQQHTNFHIANQAANSINVLSKTERRVQWVRYAPQPVPADPVICYAASENKLFKQVNNGVWTLLNGGSFLPGGDLLDIAFDPADRNHIWITALKAWGTLASPKTGELWEYEPVGASWSDITAGIPLDLPPATTTPFFNTPDHANNLLFPTAGNKQEFKFSNFPIRTLPYARWIRSDVSRFYHLPVTFTPLPTATWPVIPSPAWVPQSYSVINSDITLTGATSPTRLGITIRPDGSLYQFYRYNLQIEYDCPAGNSLTIEFGNHNTTVTGPPGNPTTTDDIDVPIGNSFPLPATVGMLDYPSSSVATMSIVLAGNANAYQFIGSGPGTIRIKSVRLTQHHPLGMKLVELPSGTGGPDELFLGVNMLDNLSYTFSSPPSPISWDLEHHGGLGRIDDYAVSEWARDRQYVINSPYSAYTEDNWQTVITGTTVNSMFHGDGSTGENHVDTRCIVLGETRSNALGDEVFVGNDGGPSYRPGGAAAPNTDDQLKAKNGPGLAISTFYGIADPDAGTGVVAGGLQDVGAYDFDPNFATNNRTAWRADVQMGDAYDCYFDKQDMNELLHTGVGNSLWEGDLNDPNAIFYDDTPRPTDPNYPFKTKPYRTDELGGRYIGWSLLWEEDESLLPTERWKEAFLPLFTGDDPQPVTFSSAHPNRPSKPKAVRVFEINPQNKLEAYVAYDAGKGDAINGLGKGYFYKREKVNNEWKWLDRTPFATEVKGYGITGIAVDPTDFDRVWVSFGQTSGGTSGGIFTSTPNQHRVYSSTDGGVTWGGASLGLPELPVNCLVYQKGSNDILYAGTDAGVYLFENSRWEPYNRLQNDDPEIVECYSPMIVIDIELNYCKDEMYVGTWGRSIWKSPMYHNSSVVKPSVFINSNTIWTGRKYLEGTVLVTTGNTLTITGNLSGPIGSYEYDTEIFMPKNGRIEVEKGAKLVILNATITNGCEERWSGIYLHGDGSSPQILNANQIYPDQGYLQASQFRLENAHTAVHNYGGIDPWPNTGGVVRVADGLFNNNRRGIEFLAYQLSPPNGRDQSQISLCEFKIDNDKDFWAHVSMWGVEGIPIKACNFSNNQGSQVSHKQGVISIDASYFLSGNGSTLGRFDGFYEGVKATGFNLYPATNSTPIRVNNIVFDNNEIGLYFNEMFYPDIRGNIFKIGAQQSPGTSPYYSIGSKLVDVSKFIYCANTHTNDYGIPNSTYTAGTEVYNTGVFNQQINKNYYQDLLVGNDAAYTCGGVDNSGIQVGLNYSCNYNQDNAGWDFIMQADAVIREVQTLDFGPTTFPNARAARNVFTDNAILNPVHWDHVNAIPNGTAAVYYHTINTFETPTSDLTTVYLQNGVTAEECENIACDNTVDKIADNENGGYGSEELQVRKTEYNTAETNYLSAVAALNQLIDDGDTPLLESEIENSTTANQMQVRAELLAISPYVSQEALKTLAEENIMTDVLMLEILLANPEATRDESFLEFLQYNAPNPLPAYMINLIRGSWTGVSPRQELERNISNFLGQMTEASNRVFLVYAADSVLHNEDSAFIWMQKVPSLRNQYLVMEYWIGKKDFVQAENILSNLPANWEMNSQELKDYTSYVQVFNFKKMLHENEIDISQLDAPKIAALKLIADNPEFGTGREMARNALCFFYQICYPAIQNPYNQSSNKTIRSIERDKEESNLKVFPNPAKDHVTFQIINADGACKDCKIIITDLQGRAVYEGKLDALSNMHIWDTREIAAGAYIYQVKTNLSVESGKVVIIK